MFEYRADAAKMKHIDCGFIVSRSKQRLVGLRPLAIPRISLPTNEDVASSLTSTFRSRAYAAATEPVHSLSPRPHARANSFQPRRLS